MLARLGLGKIAFAISIAGHVGLAVMASQRARHTACANPLQTELAAPELLRLDAPGATAVREVPEPEAERAPAKTRAVAQRATASASFEPAAGSEAVPAARPALTSASSETPRFTMLVSRASVASSGTAAPNGTTSLGSAGAVPVLESAVEVRATLRAGAPPAYTAAALAAGIETDVPLEIVIDASGSVQSAHALAHVGYGLDEAALHSVRAYRFTPAQRAGHPVPVRMRWLMRFQLA